MGNIQYTQWKLFSILFVKYPLCPMGNTQFILYEKYQQFIRIISSSTSRGVSLNFPGILSCCIRPYHPSLPAGFSCYIL